MNPVVKLQNFNLNTGVLLFVCLLICFLKKKKEWYECLRILLWLGIIWAVFRHSSVGQNRTNDAEIKGTIYSSCPATNGEAFALTLPGIQGVELTCAEFGSVVVSSIWPGLFQIIFWVILANCSQGPIWTVYPECISWWIIPQLLLLKFHRILAIHILPKKRKC